MFSLSFIVIAVIIIVALLILFSFVPELSRRIAEQFPAIDSQVSVRYATGNQLSVFGALKEDQDRISEILQETWESADDWFVHDLS